MLHRGKLVAAQRPEALALLEAFKAGPDGQNCRMLTADEAATHQPGIDGSRIVGGLYSPFELACRIA